jgi:hypothetical protein
VLKQRQDRKLRGRRLRRLHNLERFRLDRSQIAHRARGFVPLRELPASEFDRVPRLDFVALPVVIHVWQTDRWHTVAQRLEQWL